MTITIDRPQASKALPANDPTRRPVRLDSGKKAGTGSTRYTTRERQDDAAAYYDEKKRTKFLRAYVSMSPFMLEDLIRRLEAVLDTEQGARSQHDQFRLSVAEEARLEHKLGEFRLPQLEDIPNNSPVKLRRRFLDWGIQTMKSRLENLKNSKNTKDVEQRKALHERIKGFETALKAIGTTVKAAPNKSKKAKAA